MELIAALKAFDSLAQETRLRAFKVLIEYGRAGLTAGVLATELRVPANTLSFHLADLSRAKLITSKRKGRTITYFANTDRVEKLISYLRTNCCARDESGMC